jgi:hypothetical protein
VFDREGARRIAQVAIDSRVAIDDARVRELQTGWYFGCRSLGDPLAGGSNGLIVNKATGKVLHLGSAFPVERDLELYDRGYQFDRYDLVVVNVANLDATLTSLLELGLTIVEPTYEHGTVWRVPRTLTRDELAQRLRSLPCVFGDAPLYFRLETLERARASGSFRFEALEFRRPVE